MRSLTPESFDLSGQPPRVTVEAAYSKNRKASQQPIRPDLAAALHPWLDGRTAGQPVFAVPEKTAKMLRRDLDAAGVAYKDGAGRVGDFHALRHMFITMVAQELARHSTPMLTIGQYSHASLGDQAAALSALPEIGTQSGRPAAKAGGLSDQPVTSEGPDRAPSRGRSGAEAGGPGRDGDQSWPAEGSL